MRPSINVLSTNLIERILAEAKQILEKIGIEVRGAHLKQRLLDAGLKTDPTGERIMFSADVVDQAIKDCPKGFKLYNRDGKVHADLSGDNVHFVPASSGLKVHDHRTDQVRLADTKDFVEYVRLCDGLEHIAYLATAFSTNDDIEAQVSDVWRLYLCLTNSKKPIVSGAFTEEGVPRMAEMMGLFRNGRQDLIDRPMSIFTITATGNFRYSEDSCQNLLDCVEYGSPLEIVPVTLMGLIAPVTLVGATVFHTVDVLAGLVMAQIIRPGHPILFGGAPAAFHMKAATSPMVAIEALHLDVAYAAVADHLGIPTQGYMALSDTKLIDAQAGAETFGSALLAALAGINSVSGPGMLDFVLTFSLPKLIVDNDLCGQALHFCREITIADDLPTLGIVEELMREDHLITAEHTLEHWPSHLYLPDPVIDRLNRENWEKKGEDTLIERATAEVDRRLAAYEPLETDPAIEAEMRKIIKSGFEEQTELPEVPVAKKPKAQESGRKRRRRVKK
ncbi:MAG: trimethylamine methyltransferase family protein [Chloroflexota bacterium]